jgi:polyhydroxyalkanoate synthesis regulator phasin
LQTPEDDFPYSSDDPSLSPRDSEYSGSVMTSQQVGDLKATLRLVIGSVLNGRDAYLERLRLIQATADTVKPEGLVVGEEETSWEQLRYLLLGVLFETPDVIQRGLGTTERVATRVYNLISRILSPVTNSRIFDPVRNQVDIAEERGEKVIDNLIMKGRIEEQNSRLIIQQKNIDELVNDFMEYLVLKTEIRRLIQEEGVEMAGDAVDEFREQSAAIDSSLERRLRSVFRRGSSPQPGETHGDQAGGGKE